VDKSSDLDLTLAEAAVETAYLRSAAIALRQPTTYDRIRPYIDHYAPDDLAAPILDAASGPGVWSRYLRQRGYRHLDAVDLLDNVDIPGVRYQRASLRSLPFPDATFDFCMLLSAIYYLDDPSAALREVHRVLKPGGCLLLTAHTRYSPYTALRAFKRYLRLPSAAHLTCAHFESVAAYDRYLSAAGFEVILRDGYRTALGIIGRALSRRLLGKTPPPHRTQGALLRWYKSWFAYHAILVARKR